ncbi:hypothetical protein F5Y18DRAFT_436583 [Xylariaceae sp. FL1019]|nr:hypothetical protein F5Y18DRAFT_436583 [Xylariaceae sp. FL1019]
MPNKWVIIVTHPGKRAKHAAEDEMTAANSKKPRTRGNGRDNTSNGKTKTSESLLPIDVILEKDEVSHQQTTQMVDNDESESSGNYVHSNEFEPPLNSDYQDSVSRDVAQWSTPFTTARLNNFTDYSIHAFSSSLPSSPLGCSLTAILDQQNQGAATVNLTENIQQNLEPTPDGQIETSGLVTSFLPSSGAPADLEPYNVNGNDTSKLTKTSQTTILDEIEGLPLRCRCLQRVLVIIEELGLELAQPLGTSATRLDYNLRSHKMAIHVAQQTLSCDLCCSRFESLMILNLLSDQLATLCRRLVRCYAEPRPMCLGGEGTGNKPYQGSVIGGSVFWGEYELDCAVEREMVLRPLILIQLRQLKSPLRSITKRKEALNRPAFAAEIEIDVMMDTIQEGAAAAYAATSCRGSSPTSSLTV